MRQSTPSYTGTASSRSNGHALTTVRAGNSTTVRGLSERGSSMHGSRLRVSQNAAEWRNRQKPNRIIHTAPECCPEFSRVNDINTMALNLSGATNTSVVIEADPKEGMNFLIYGKGLHLEKAVKHVNDWVENAKTKSGPSNAWAKLGAFNVYKWYKEEAKILEYNRKREYIRAPPPDATFPFASTYEWPVELQMRGLTPRDAFGLQLEHLDHVRMHNEVYISLVDDSGQKLAIKVQGDRKENICTAWDEINNKVNKVHSKFLSSEPINIIVDEAEGNTVVLNKPSEWPVPSPNLVPRLEVDLLMAGTKQSSYQQSLSDERLAKIQHSLRCMLESIRYERGAYDFTIRYGSIGIETHSDSTLTGTTHSLDRFRQGLATNLALKPVMKRWIGHHDTENQLLGRLMKADWLLEPTPKSGWGSFSATSLKDVSPTLRGLWYLKERGVPQAFALFINWAQNEDENWEVTSKTFYKIRAEDKGPKQHMKLNIMELIDGRGWHFALQSFEPLPAKHVPPALKGFADKVTLKKSWTEHQSRTESFAIWSEGGSVQTLDGRLDIIHEFSVKGTEYRVQANMMWLHRKKTPFWGCLLYHTDWKMRLAPLERLPPGDSADFSRNPIRSFFPASEDTGAEFDDTTSLLHLVDMDERSYPPAVPGVKALMKIMADISQIIKGEE